MRWFSSDWHLNHANILRFTGRPFRDLDHMRESFIHTINSTVGLDDELWLLGDMCMGSLDESLPALRRLNVSRIVFVAGNHDRVHPYYGNKHTKFLPLYQEATGLTEFILTGTTLELDGGPEVVVNHFPYPSPENNRAGFSAATGTTVEDKFARWRPVDTGGWLLCGHVHSAWRQDGRQINVGVDAWAGQPVPETTILDLIHNGPARLPSIDWNRAAA